MDITEQEKEIRNISYNQDQFAVAETINREYKKTKRTLDKCK